MHAKLLQGEPEAASVGTWINDIRIVTQGRQLKPICDNTVIKGTQAEIGRYMMAERADGTFSDANVGVTRRKFVKATALTAAGFALFGVSGCANGTSEQATSATSPASASSTASSAASTSTTSADDLAWWQKTIVYECYPKSFQDTGASGIGNLQGVISRLDYLASLGVGALWLTPVYDSPQKDNGYDVADYEAIWPQFGTMHDMDELIAQADKRGIKVIMDLVFNHTSQDNPWFVESRSSRDNAKADWYIWRDGKTPGAPEQGGTPPTNWGSIFGGSAWEWDSTREQWYLHTFGTYQPDLNWENPDVRAALYDIANFWVNKGVGGFRIDAVTYIKKPAEFVDGGEVDVQGLSPIHDATANTEGILDFLHEFKREVREGHDIFCVGEANGVPADELGDWVGDDGVFDMIFEFSVMHVPMDESEQWFVPADWKLTDIKEALAASQRNTAQNGWYPIFWGNHDQPRCVSNFFPADVDQTAAAKVLACVLMTMRGTPFVYQGDELGLANVAWSSIDAYNDDSSHNQFQLAIENGLSEAEALACVQRYSRDNARTPMQWDATANAGFTHGTPWLPVHDDYAQQNVAVQDADASSVLSWYRQLAELRSTREELLAGSWEELMPDSEEIYAFQRVLGDKRTVTLVNWTDHEVAYDTALVQGLEVLAGSIEGAEAGVLRPLEAVIWATKA